MSRYPAIDALLATRRPLPAPAERSRLRASLALTADAVAHAIGISPATLHAWEEGHAEPQGHARAAYAYFLTHARTCAAEDPNLALNQPAPDTSTELLPQHTFCVLCGNPASQQVDGYPQHLTAAECAEAATPLPTLSLPKPDETPQPPDPPHPLWCLTPLPYPPGLDRGDRRRSPGRPRRRSAPSHRSTHRTHNPRRHAAAWLRSLSTAAFVQPFGQQVAVRGLMNVREK